MADSRLHSGARSEEQLDQYDPAMKKTEYKAQQVNMPGENVAPEVSNLTRRERQMKKDLEQNKGKNKEAAALARVAAKKMTDAKQQSEKIGNTYQATDRSHTGSLGYIEDAHASPEDRIAGYIRYCQQQSNGIERNNTPENTKRINDHARRALAGATLSCMMALESRDKPILRTMVEKGGTEQLVRMIMNNKGFQEQFAAVNTVGGDEKQSLNHLLEKNANFAGPVAVGITKKIVQAQKLEQEQKQKQADKPRARTTDDMVPKARLCLSIEKSCKRASKR